MTDDTSQWVAQLRAYAAECRAVAPLPENDALSDAQKWHYRIVGGSLLTWLQQHGPQFLQARVALCTVLGIDRDPAIVFTSDVPGLLAAQEIIGPHHERVVYLLKEEFAALSLRQADREFKHHVHVWSYFRSEPESEFVAQARSMHPIPERCSYWQHVEGTMWAMRAGRGGDHLWKWDGRKPELLKEAISHWVS